MLLAFGLVAIAAALGLGSYVTLAGRSIRTTGDDSGVGGICVPLSVGSAHGTPADAAWYGAAPKPRSVLERRLGGLGSALMRKDYLHRLQHRLDLAGNPAVWLPERVLAVKGAGLVAGILVGLATGAKHGAALAVLFMLLAGALGVMAPDMIVRSLGEKRQLNLQRQLSDALDMLTVCVEAGLGFDSAVSRVARNLTGPVAEEFARVLQEMQFGMSRTQALRSLVARTDVPELRTFVAAMVQSGELGISIGDVLREQSRQMRIKRRQRAEERAQKLQVKLLLPLITCLLPSIFVVVLGPAIIHLMQFFSSAK
jgi:tight adherence protein C